MTGEDIFRALGGIDGALIMDAAPVPKRRKTRAFTRWSGLAASLFLVVATLLTTGVTLAVKTLFPSQSEIPQSDGQNWGENYWYEESFQGESEITSHILSGSGVKIALYGCRRTETADILTLRLSEMSDCEAFYVKKNAYGNAHPVLGVETQDRQGIEASGGDALCLENGERANVLYVDILFATGTFERNTANRYEGAPKMTTLIIECASSPDAGYELILFCKRTDMIEG